MNFTDGVDADTALAAEKQLISIEAITAVQAAINVLAEAQRCIFNSSGLVVSVVMDKGETYKNNPDALVDLVDFTDVTQMSELTDTAANKISEKDGDLASFNAIVDDLESAVVNVNAAIDQATDILSPESQALFALSSELKTQIKLAAEDPENSNGKIISRKHQPMNTYLQALQMMMSLLEGLVMMYLRSRR